MRPAVLNPLFTPASSLKGVGPRVKEALARLLRVQAAWETGGQGEVLVRDLLFHLPTGCTDRRRLYTLGEAPVDRTVTLCVTVEKHYPSSPARNIRSPYRIACADETADMLLVFFHAREDYLRSQLPEGRKRLISGTLERYDGVLQIVHPEVIALPEQREDVLRLEANYPLTQQLGAKKLRSLIAQALTHCPDLPEWLLDEVKTPRGWQGWRASLARLHQPQEPDDLAPESPFRQRLAYDEILANQLALAIVRRQSVQRHGIRITGDSALRARLKAALPFALTVGQEQVLGEIDEDYASGNRMLRLLQGDVGSGKTVVALLAMCPLFEHGYQAALMAPTEILGRQHLAAMQPLLEPLGLRAVLLSGRQPAAERQEALRRIEAGEAQLVIGTHALFQGAVRFHRLGLAVIDEQHRFGVKQRLALAGKGEHPHLLLMTATPIPRSLTMTAYGDMDSSLLSEKPAHRQPIDTRAVPLSRLDEVVEGLKRAMAAGNKAYWICPLVEEAEEGDASPAGDLAAAEERYRVFRNVFGEDRVALMHGRMKPEEREEAMQGFAGERFDLLVATTVVEVGVNVPEATIMVIEHAERFGLAQLHQLRGRVGRGAAASSCILLYGPRCSEVAQQRLRIIRETNDGFRIAEEDLLLRGAGDVLGTRQSGMPDFRFADLAAHRELMLAARDDVKWILHHDAALYGERGQALRVLLYLFGYDESLRYLKAG